MERKGDHRGTAAPFSAHMQSLQCGMHAVLSLRLSCDALSLSLALGPLLVLRAWPTGIHCVVVHLYRQHLWFAFALAHKTLAAVLAKRLVPLLGSKKKNASFHCLSTCLTILICCTNICFWKIKGPSTPFRPIVVEDLIHLSKGRKHTHHSKFEIRTSPVSCWILFFLPPPRVFSLLFGLPSRTSERRSCRRGALGFSGTSPVSTALKGAWGGRLARW